MREDLIAYALGELDDDDRLRIEQSLADDPALRDELAQIEECLGDFSDEPADEGDQVPAGLADRTTAGILAGRSQSNLPRPNSTLGGWAAATGFMSPMDMTVAIGILITLGSLLFPAVYSSRNQAQQLSCANNLGRLGQLLTMYADENRGYYPVVRPTEHAGIFAPRLREADFVRAGELDQLLVCPSSPLAQQLEAEGRDFHVPSLAELSLAEKSLSECMWLVERKRDSGGSYGYQVGYMRGNFYLPAKNHRHSLVPVLADTPSVVANYSRSANHDGKLVNTLFQDGSVRGLEIPRVPCANDHLFVNQQGLPSAGSSWDDAVVLPSGALPGVDPETQQMPEAVYHIMFRVR